MILTNSGTPLRFAYIEDNAEDARNLLESWKLHHLVNPLDIYPSAGAFFNEVAAPFPTMPDVVIMDLSLPDVHGTDVAKIMREEPRLTKIPIFIVTASDQETAEMHARLMGAAGWAIKPVLAPNLMDVLMDIKRRRPRFGLQIVWLDDDETRDVPEATA